MAKKVEVDKMEQFGQALSIGLDDGRTIVARPRPEDQDYLAQAGGETRISLRTAGDDTEGHSISNELTVDVEGHAVTLRLPTTADAEALRKALAVGLVTATIVAAGAIASMQGSQAPAQAGPGAADKAAPAERAQFGPNDDIGLADHASQAASAEFAAQRAGAGAPAEVRPAPGVGIDILREQRLAKSEAVPASGTGTSAAGAEDSNGPDTQETRSGPLEFDR